MAKTGGYAEQMNANMRKMVADALHKEKTMNDPVTQNILADLSRVAPDNIKVTDLLMVCVPCGREVLLEAPHFMPVGPDAMKFPIYCDSCLRKPDSGRPLMIPKSFHANGHFFEMVNPNPVPADDAYDDYILRDNSLLRQHSDAHDTDEFFKNIGYGCTKCQIHNGFYAVFNGLREDLDYVPLSPCADDGWRERERKSVGSVKFTNINSSCTVCRRLFSSAMPWWDTKLPNRFFAACPEHGMRTELQSFHLKGHTFAMEHSVYRCFDCDAEIDPRTCDDDLVLRELAECNKRAEREAPVSTAPAAPEARKHDFSDPYRYDKLYDSRRCLCGLLEMDLASMHSCRDCPGDNGTRLQQEKIVAEYVARMDKERQNKRAKGDYAPLYSGWGAISYSMRDRGR